jgi:protein TonB
VQADAVQLYAASLNSRVQAGLVVPATVSDMGLSGSTTVAVTIAPNGHVVSVTIARSSGIPPIDQAALAAVRATTEQAFTTDMPDHPITFTLIVHLDSQTS